MTNSACEDQLTAFKSDRLTYPTQIRAYLYNEVDKYVMIWETKKVASDANTQWDASCSLTSEQFEERKTACDNLGYQVFHVHKHTNRFIKR
jgi:hypothetical protein